MLTVFCPRMSKTNGPGVSPGQRLLVVGSIFLALGVLAYVGRTESVFVAQVGVGEVDVTLPIGGGGQTSPPPLPVPPPLPDPGIGGGDGGDSDDDPGDNPADDCEEEGDAPAMAGAEGGQRCPNPNEFVPCCTEGKCSVIQARRCRGILGGYILEGTHSEGEACTDDEVKRCTEYPNGKEQFCCKPGDSTCSVRVECSWRERRMGEAPRRIDPETGRPDPNWTKEKQACDKACRTAPPLPGPGPKPDPGPKPGPKPDPGPGPDGYCCETNSAPLEKRCPSKKQSDCDGTWWRTPGDCKIACSDAFCCNPPAGEMCSTSMQAVECLKQGGVSYKAGEQKKCEKECGTGFCCVIDRRNPLRPERVEACTPPKSYEDCARSAARVGDGRFSWNVGSVQGDRACRAWCGLPSGDGRQGAGAMRGEGETSSSGLAGAISRLGSVISGGIGAFIGWLGGLFR